MKLVAGVLFVCYVLFLLVCAFVAVMDPLTGHGYEGLVGFTASLAAGLPWTLVFLEFDLPTRTVAGLGEEGSLVALCWTAAMGNALLFGRLCFWLARRRPPKSSTGAPPAPP